MITYFTEWHRDSPQAEKEVADYLRKTAEMLESGKLVLEVDEGSQWVAYTKHPDGTHIRFDLWMRPS